MAEKKLVFLGKRNRLGDNAHVWPNSSNKGRYSYGG
jgi:hypothetical protein